MKKIENQTVYQCSYCTKISKSAAGIYQHEKFCKKNPHNNFICVFCIHLRREEHLSEEGENAKHVFSIMILPEIAHSPYPVVMDV